MITVCIRTLILYILVVLAVRMMGRRTIGELQASELVVTLMISDLASVPMQEIGIPLLTGALPIAVLVIMEIALSSLMLHSPRLSRLMCGSPVVVIAGGEIRQKALRSLRMTNSDLFESLRKQSVFDIAAVSCAVVETDGSLSVLLRAEAQPPTAADAGVEVPKERINALLVSDGSIERNSLTPAVWSEERIEKALKKEKTPVEDVFVMTGAEDGSYRIIRRDGEDAEKQKGRRGV